MSKLIAGLVIALLSTPVVAADTSYSLFEGLVKFSAPAEWPVMMEKKEGIPQFIAFQVVDPAAQGSGEASQVSVEAKLLNDASTSQALINAGIDKAKQAQGFEARSDAGANAMHYVALNGKQRYEYRESWILNSRMLTHIRCARPLLAATSAAWTQSYEAGCKLITQSIKP